MSLNLAFIGFGKIARDQHLPAVRDSSAFVLTAGVDPLAGMAGLPHYPDLEALLASDTPVDAVALCTPPQMRFRLASKALAAGKHVLMEKPPGVGISEIDALQSLAQTHKRVVFTAWHSRAAAGVEPARAWLRQRRVVSVRIDWKEDVRRWHPGQEWIWQPGGLGVFDPGINALSILTALIEEPIFVRGGELWVPSNRQTPIRADLDFVSAGGAPIACVLDWTEQGRQVWDIVINTDAGRLVLSEGGNRLSLDGVEQDVGAQREYANLYAEFAALIESSQSAIDGRPLRLALDALALAARYSAPPFED